MSLKEKFRRLVIITAITNLVWQSSKNWKHVLEALIDERYQDLDKEELECVIAQLIIDSKDKNFKIIEDQPRIKEQPQRKRACEDLARKLSSLKI